MPIEFTSDRFRQLCQTNLGVNNGVKYVSDRQQYGQEEFWANADITHRGDCEDYAEAKYSRLRGLGWPQDALNFAICKVDGVGHCVLVATLGDHDYVLDNNISAPVLWSSLHDREWLAVTKNGSFLHWYAVE